jgi:hypothetical protein
MPPVFEPARGVLVSTLVILAVLVWTRAFSNTDTAESRISLEEWNKPAQGVLIRNVSKMKSKSSLVLREIGSIFVDENIFCVRGVGVFLLVGGRRHHLHIGSHLSSELYG